MLSIFTPWSVLAGLLLTGPSLLEAFNNRAVPLEGVIARFLIATVIAGIGLRWLTGLIDSYQAGYGRARPSNRATDAGNQLPRSQGADSVQPNQ